MQTLDTVSKAYANVTVSWDTVTSTAWTKLRLLRSAAGTPRDERDGNVLFEDDFATARTSYTDEGLTTGRYYYYALFALTSAGWVNTSTATFLVTKDWGYTGKLYQSLPEVFRSPDYADVRAPVVSPEESLLYRFLAAFGYGLDSMRTEIESIRTMLDALVANQTLLPSLSNQVGLTYEPEIGAPALRKLIANAVHLWSIKGTVQGVRELASVLTGYVTHVRIGHNLALDGLDAGPTTDKGRWIGRTNCVVTYRANALTDTNPAGEGVRLLTATAAGAIVADTNAGGTDPLLRRQYAIPVLPSRDYTVSQYVLTTGAAGTIQSQLTWLDGDGQVIGGTASGAAVTLDATWRRPTVTATSPVNARYLIPGVQTSALTAGQVVEHCGLQVQEGDVATTWECARETLIYFDPQTINYIGNTSGGGSSTFGWSTGVSVVVDPTLGNYLIRYTPDPEDPNKIYPLDAVLVDYPGDVVPPPPAPADSLAPTEVYYTGAHQAVAAGQVWTVLADAIPPLSDTSASPVRYGQVGFRLYSGSTLVGHYLGTQIALADGVFTSLPPCELDVPAGAAYDHIELCIITDGPCGFRHAALEPVNKFGAFFFDGSTPSTTGDYLWGGTPFQSPSYAYDRRSSRTVRLRALLIDYLPNGACYDIVFAAAAVPASSPASISGPDPDPATALPL